TTADGFLIVPSRAIQASNPAPIPASALLWRCAHLLGGLWREELADRKLAPRLLECGGPPDQLAKHGSGCSLQRCVGRNKSVVAESGPGEGEADAIAQGYRRKFSE